MLGKNFSGDAFFTDGKHYSFSSNHVTVANLRPVSDVHGFKF